MPARVFLFLAIFISGFVHAQTHETLDEFLDPDQLAIEVGNPNKTNWEPLTEEVSTEKNIQATSINPYQEFPLVIEIIKSTQRMKVYQNGTLLREMKTSTGREEWERPPGGSRYYSSTPNGWYSPQRFTKKHKSYSWGSTMRYSIFFNGGIAIHATSLFKYLNLGKNTSAGCVRLSYGNAKWLWNLARSQRRTVVPVYDRSGQILTDSNGQIQRQKGSPVLIIVKN